MRSGGGRTVITLTTSKGPVYSEDANARRLGIRVGAFTPERLRYGREHLVLPVVARAAIDFVDG